MVNKLTVSSLITVLIILGISMASANVNIPLPISTNTTIIVNNITNVTNLPNGSNFQIQFYNGGNFGSDPTFSWNPVGFIQIGQSLVGKGILGNEVSLQDTNNNIIAQETDLSSNIYGYGNNGIIIDQTHPFGNPTEIQLFGAVNGTNSNFYNILSLQDRNKNTAIDLNQRILTISGGTTKVDFSGSPNHGASISFNQTSNTTNDYVLIGDANNLLVETGNITDLNNNIYSLGGNLSGNNVYGTNLCYKNGTNCNSGSAGGNDTNILFNDKGNENGSKNLIYNKTINLVNFTGTSAIGNVVSGSTTAIEGQATGDFTEDNDYDWNTYILAYKTINGVNIFSQTPFQINFQDNSNAIDQVWYNVSWTAVSGASGYEIVNAPDSGDGDGWSNTCSQMTNGLSSSIKTTQTSYTFSFCSNWSNGYALLPNQNGTFNSNPPATFTQLTATSINTSNEGANNLIANNLAVNGINGINCLSSAQPTISCLMGIENLGADPIYDPLGVNVPQSGGTSYNYDGYLFRIDLRSSQNAFSIVHYITNGNTLKSDNVSIPLLLNRIGFGITGGDATSQNTPFYVNFTNNHTDIGFSNSQDYNINARLLTQGNSWLNGTVNITQNLTFNQHIITTNTTSKYGTTVVSCGTSPSIIGTDTAGIVTVGSGISTTSCQINFGTPYSTNVSCTISDNSLTATGDISSLNKTSLVTGFGASLSGGTLYYHCYGIG